MKIKIQDVLFALLSGVLTALSLPKFNLSFFAWISFIPLFFVIVTKSPKQSFFLGLMAGFSYYAILIYWIPAVPAHYGNMSLGLSIGIYIIFVLYLAFFWALFCFLFNVISQTFPKMIFFLAPFLWVSFEYILTFFLSGFPWGIIGYSQHSNISFIQLASVAGVYGLSFMLIFLQSFFLFSIKLRKKIPFFTALSLVLLIHIGGFLSLKRTASDKERFTVSVIQGNVSSDIYWDRVSSQEKWDLFDQHLRLSHQAYERGARLIIWPEFSVPLCFSCPYGLSQDFKDKLYQFVQETQCTLLLGTNEYTGSRGGTHLHNSALSLHPNLSTSLYYKIHLVPFGEYIPYKKIFFFIEKITHAIGEITPGTQYSLHRFEGKKFGSPICFEIIFPNLVRKFVKKGAQFLVTITNDGWYGKSSAPYQHFSIAVLRAVENRRYLLRSATTGISGIIDPYGRVISRSELMTKTYLIGDITSSKTLTIYTKYGDILPIGSLTLAGLFLILGAAKRKSEKKRPLF